MDAVDESLLYLSVLTVGEIRKGLARLPQGKRRSQLETWLDSDLPVRFARRVLAVDAGVADRWGWMMAQAKEARKTLPVIDSLLAATALHHNLTMVSRNVGDFVDTHVPVLNPWEA
jgi:predicted nucleic acid-binding protein